MRLPVIKRRPIENRNDASVRYDVPVMNRREFVFGTAGLLAVRQTLKAETKPFRIWSGLPSLDEATGGFGPGEVVQIAGNGASGRSGLALQIASHNFQSVPVAYFAPYVPWIGNFEIDTKTRCLHRIIGPIALVDLHRLRYGYLTQGEKAEARRAEEACAKKKLFIYGSLEKDDWGLESVGKMARKLWRENDLKLLVVDDLMELHPRQSCTELRSKAQLIAMGTFFANLAEELQITVLVCGGLSLQTGKRPDCRPERVDLAGYGLPEEYCSTVVLTYRPAFVRPDLPDFQRRAEITLTKTRTGRTGTLDMGWNQKFARFEEAQA